MTDSEAIQQVRSGDMDGLRVLYDRHRGRIYQLGCRYMSHAMVMKSLRQVLAFNVLRDDVAGTVFGAAYIVDWDNVRMIEIGNAVMTAR